MKKAETYWGKSIDELNIYEKRFIIMMKLYKIGKMMEEAKITFPTNNQSTTDNPQQETAKK